MSGITIQFLCQPLDDSLGQHHLAVDHALQLFRIDAQLRLQLMEIGVMGGIGADVLGDGVDLLDKKTVLAAFEAGASPIRVDPARPPQAAIVRPGDRRGRSPKES
jgi:hypothetical protein